MLVVGAAQAGISGRFETWVEQDNRQLHSESGFEERLGLLYNNPASGLRSGLSLALSQRQGKRDETLTLLYLEKPLNDKRTLLSLGRLQRSDAFGFYTLDGLLFKQIISRATLTLYGGVPSRIEGFRSVDGEALYGFDVQTSAVQFNNYKLDSRFGWQRLKQSNTVNRVNIGGRGIHQQTAIALFPSAFSFAGSYLVGEQTWESVQLNAHRDFENNMRLRMDYETYQPDKDELTFKDRFYSLYAHGRQSQFKLGYQLNQRQQHTWSLSGRRVTREFGSNGYGLVATMDYRSDHGWRLATQFNHLALADERLNGLYLEAEKALSSMVRGTLSGVFQQQQKRLTGDNRSTGIEARLERRVKLKVLPSALWFSAETIYIHNSRLVNEYRIAMRLSYSFDDRTRESLQ